MPTLDSGLCTALKPTLRLPWADTGSIPMVRRRRSRHRFTGGATKYITPFRLHVVGDHVPSLLRVELSYSPLPSPLDLCQGGLCTKPRTGLVGYGLVYTADRVPGGSLGELLSLCLAGSTVTGAHAPALPGCGARCRCLVMPRPLPLQSGGNRNTPPECSPNQTPINDKGDAAKSPPFALQCRPFGDRDRPGRPLTTDSVRAED